MALPFFETQDIVNIYEDIKATVARRPISLDSKFACIFYIVVQTFRVFKLF